MTEHDYLSRVAPVVLIGLAAVWAIARIAYLRRAGRVAVLSVSLTRKTGVELGLAAVAVVLDGYLLLRLFFPRIDSMLAVSRWALPEIGVTFMAVGLLLMGISQVQMGNAWRIGIPGGLENSQRLVKSGFYRYSRNPIYLCIGLFMVGAVLVAPGVLTLMCFLAYCLLIRMQVRREESFLQAGFGCEFEKYCRQTRRWL